MYGIPVMKIPVPDGLTRREVVLAAGLSVTEDTRFWIRLWESTGVDPSRPSF
jgi:hypothetical protein